MRRFTTVRVLAAIASIALCGAVASAGQDVKITEKDVKKYMDAAEKEIKDGNLQKAGGFYLTIVTNFPERGDVHLKLARIYRHRNDWANAGTAYSKAVSSVTDPAEQAECYEGMTIAYSKEPNYPKVVEVGKKAVELNPSNADVMVAFAIGLAKTGAIAEAGQMAQKALALAPESALVHATIGEAALADGKPAEAEPAFRKAIELDGKVAEAHAGLADILLAKKDYQGAVAEATKALELNSELTRAFGTRGKANHALGNRSAAQSDLAMAITVNPNDPDANLAYAEVYLAEGNLSMAAGYFQKAVTLNPNLTSAYVSLGDIYIKQGKLQEAGDLMKQAVEKMPDNAQVHHYLGLSLAASQQPDQALAEFSKAVELDDSLAAAHYQKGKILRLQKQVAPALVELEKAVSLEADNPDFLTELGVGYYEGQQPDKARETLAKATSLPGYENALGWAYYGVTLKDKQQFKDAAGYFQKAVDAYPNFGLAHWGLAWSAFGQIAKGCPCTPEDEALVKTLVEHAKAAVQYGVNDASLTERADILGRGEKVT